MKEENIKLIIVLAVALAAVIGLFAIMDVDLTPAMTGAVIYSDTSVPSDTITQFVAVSDSVQEPTETSERTSAGCCNWDCESYHWICRTRSLDCSIGKPILTCRK